MNTRLLPGHRAATAVLFAILLIAAMPEPVAGQLAKGHAKFLGNVYSSAQLERFEFYWNQVTPENAGKWGSAEPQRDVMNWSTLDAMYSFAKTNGYVIRFHVLVWGNQQPRWIESLPPNEQLEEIEEWFAAVAQRYPDLDYVEVVNEPLHDPPNQSGNGGGNYYEALGGAGSSGWEWVLNAFRMARTHFPTAKLLINDYNIVSSTSNTNRYKTLIELLQAENLIDGIGVQAHAFSTRGSAAGMTANLDRLATTGLPIQVTEMDIDGPSDLVQWQDYQRIFPVFWEHPSVVGVTLWGWRPGMWRTAEGATLIKENGTEKIALDWLRSYLRNILASVEPRAEQPAGFSLLGNYPNPFNPNTTVEYRVETAGTVRLEVFDLTGAPVVTLVNGFGTTGTHRVDWDGRDARGMPVPSGVYVYRLSQPGNAATPTATRRMVLLK